MKSEPTCNGAIDFPELSVVIASFTSERALARCLESLAPQLGDGVHSEVIAAASLPAAAIEALQQRFPEVRFLAASKDADVFRLRSLGTKEAKGRQIALLEDHVTVAPGWLAGMVSAQRKGRRIVGGPVDNGNTEKAYDWALYFVEYGLYMPPWQEGEAPILSGINVAYDRALLESCRSVWEEAFRENEVHDVLRSAGHELYSAPEAWVKSHLEMSLTTAAAHLFAGGCHFGCYRKSQAAGFSRLLWPLVSPAVPFVLALRMVRQIARRQPQRLWNLLLGKPFYLALLFAWSLGEGLGYLGFGERKG